MGKYKKSISEYYDVRLCMDFAAEKAREEGVMAGMEKGMASIIQKSFQMNLPVEVVIELTGYTEEQILRLKKN